MLTVLLCCLKLRKLGEEMQTEIKFRWLLLGSFLVNVGNSFIWPLTTVYIHDQLHQSLTVSGIVLLFYWAVI